MVSMTFINLIMFSVLQENIVKNPETNKWENVENIIRDILGEIK